MTKMRALFLLLFASAAIAQQVGPQDRSCLSSFSVGYSNCGAPPQLPKPAASEVSQAKLDTPPPVAPTPKVVKGVAEADVDAYIQNYGKPTRESARAMLDPTDENIAAMARSIRQQTATASYIAGRMTNLQQIDPGLIAINPSFTSEDLPFLSGMRVVLHTAVGCAECDKAVVLLQRLVAESPILDARVVVHGTTDPKSLLMELGRIGITLPATAATQAQTRFASHVPLAIAADTRYGKETLIKEFRNTQEFRTSLANVRRASLAEVKK
jgi:hypothetical protein